MINYTIYNSNKIRKTHGLCMLENPDILENDLLFIINKYMSYMNLFPIYDIYDDRLNGLSFEYITLSNILKSGYLPFGYIYQDIIRNIMEQKTSNNFTHTLESIFIDNNSSYKIYDSIDTNELVNVSYEILHNFICSTKFPSYRYMERRGKCILIVTIPSSDGLFAYILTTGFNYKENIDYFSTSTNSNDINALGFSRYAMLKMITTYILGKNRPSITRGTDLLVNLEMINSRKFASIENCKKYVSSLDTHYRKYLGYKLDWQTIGNINTSIIPLQSTICDKYTNVFNLPDEKIGSKFFRYINKIAEIQEIRENY